MKTLTVAIYGMSCGGCSGQIERGLAKLEGVEEVKASHEENLAVIRYDSSLVESAEFNRRIENAVQKMGFSLKDD